MFLAFDFIQCDVEVSNFEHNLERKKEKLALFMKRIINFQQMMRIKGVLLRKDRRIINLLFVG